MTTQTIKTMNQIFALLLTFCLLAACGGGGGGGGTSTPPATTYTLTYAAASNGSLTGTTSQTINQGSNATTVTAIPATGYHFVNWTDNGIAYSVSAALTVNNVTANHVFVANFAADSVTKTTATLKINLYGTLPSNTAIAGADFTLVLPANVAPALTNGNVATGVVTPSGTLNGSSISPQVIYTPAVNATPGTLHVTVASSTNSGVNQVGEVATIVLQLANGVLPATGDFSLTNTSATDATLYALISGITANIAGVTLQ